MIKSKRMKGAAFAAAAIALIGGFEGLRLNSYPDVIGVWTACYGETKGIRKGMRFTKPECDKMFAGRLAEFETKMQACIKNPDMIPDKPYLAFLSLSYNIGTGAFCKPSTVVNKINAGDLKGACNAIALYDKAGGHVVQGLKNRRKKEVAFCLSGL